MGKIPTILQVVPALDLGGAEKNALDCAYAVAHHGWNSMIASRGGKWQERAENQGISHKSLPLDSKNPITIIKNAKHLEKLLVDENIDLIHVHSRAPAWSVKLAANKLGIAYITSYHGLYSNKNAFKRWYNGVMASGARVIANSKFTAGKIIERHPNCHERLEIISPGTDMTQFDKKAISDARKKALSDAWQLGDFIADDNRGKLVLFLGRLTRAKGADLFIKAAQNVLKMHPKTQFIIAGGSKAEAYRSELQAMIDKFEAKKSQFRGQIKSVGQCNDPASALALSDLLVVPSRAHETFGLAGVEGQAMGVPAIVSNRGALLETVITQAYDLKGFTGWQFDVEDDGDLTRIMSKALSLSPQELDEIGQRGRQFVERHYSINAMREQLIALYQDVIGEKSA